MPENRAQTLGVGELTAQRVVNDALAMLRQSFARIVFAALVFFALPAAIAVFAERALLSMSTGVGGVPALVAYGAVIAAVSFRVLGPVAFAGFLDEAVAKQYLHGDHHSLSEVMKSLPWRPLIIADVLVVVAVAIGLALFVVPGLVAFGGLGLVGPVIVQEHASVMSSFRRTIRLAASAPLLVAGLVVTPFAVEQIVHELILHTLESSGIGVQLIAEWLLAVVLGGSLGLLEVALATELMARNPRQPVPGSTVDAHSG